MNRPCNPVSVIRTTGASELRTLVRFYPSDLDLVPWLAAPRRQDDAVAVVPGELEAVPAAVVCDNLKATLKYSKART